MAPLHSLGPMDPNEVKHDFFSHFIPLVQALMSFDANFIIIGIICSFGEGHSNKV